MSQDQSLSADHHQARDTRKAVHGVCLLFETSEAKCCHDEFPHSATGGQLVGIFETGL